MLFEAELAFEGVVDRLDQLSHRFEQGFFRPRNAVAVGGPQQPDVAGRQEAVELMRGVALVRQDQQAGPGGGGGWDARRNLRPPPPCE
ncbi:hypothetical protein AB0A98_06795, partial [Streptomyces chrestomyceticus]